MSKMNFFEEVDGIGGVLLSFDAIPPGAEQTLERELQPALSPIQVEQVSILVAVLDFGATVFRGYLGDITVSLSYDGKEYDLAYTALNRARQINTQEVLQTPEILCDSSAGDGYAMAYALPLAGNRAFLIHPGLKAKVKVTRSMPKGAAETDMNILFAGVLASEQATLSGRRNRLRGELNEMELAALRQFEQEMADG